MPMALEQGAVSGHASRVVLLQVVDRGIELIDSIRAVGDDPDVEDVRTARVHSFRVDLVGVKCALGQTMNQP